MKIRNISILILILIFKISSASVTPFLSERDVVDLQEWKFIKGDPFRAQNIETDISTWQSISVPHTYNMDAINSAGYYQGMAWYRTNIPKGTYNNNQRVFIRFEGVSQNAIVFLNGKKVGSHSGSYSAFAFELTDIWDFGKENIIAVRVDNTTNHKTIPVSNFLFNIYGGVYRPVALFSTPKTCISPTYHASSGVFIETKKLTENTADVEVRVHVSSDKEQSNQLAKVEIQDASGKTIATLNKTIQEEKEGVQKFTFRLEQINRWHGIINPYLYKAIVTLSSNGAIDKVPVAFGIRSFSVDANEGFILNGQSYKVNGVCRHQEWEQTANALSNEHHKIDMDLIREMGATGLRLAHYQQADYMYQLADEYGIVVWAEIPQVHTWTGSEHNNAKSQLTELILQNFNHPSICFWGLFNEVRGFNKTDAPCVKLTRELNEMAHQLDPTRLTTSATDRNMGDSMNDISDLQGWNKYLGWYGNDPYSAVGKFFDNIHNEYPELKISVSEYGAGANIKHQIMSKTQKPLGNYFPEQGQTKYHEEAWNELRQRDYLWGTFLWNMFDFGVNQWYRGGKNHRNHKGLITFDRKIKKDAFFFYKANWNPQPMLYLTERRNVNRTQSNVNIKAYCNLPTHITLSINGKQVGKGKVNEIKVIEWKNISLKKGRNVINVTCKHKGKVFTDTITWNFFEEI